MKNFKRILGYILSLIVCFSVAMAVFADDSNNLVMKDLYQMLDSYFYTESKGNTICDTITDP